MIILCRYTTLLLYCANCAGNISAPASLISDTRSSLQSSWTCVEALYMIDLHYFPLWVLSYMPYIGSSSFDRSYMHFMKLINGSASWIWLVLRLRHLKVHVQACKTSQLTVLLHVKQPPAFSQPARSNILRSACISCLQFVTHVFVEVFTSSAPCTWSARAITSNLWHNGSS